MAEDDKHNAARDAERTALQRKRSIAIAVSLGLLAVLFYIATVVKMSGGLVEKAGS
jgi:hypothetical protein